MDWKSIIGSVAPTLATALGGPLAGMAAAVASRILFGGGDEKATPEQVIEHVMANQTPEVFARLREIDANLKIELKKLDIKLEEIEAQDRASARQREIAAGGWGTFGVYALAAIILGGFFAVVYWVFTGAVLSLSPEMLLLVGSTVGYVSAKADQVVAYFFGSSIGSKQKTDEMARAMAQTVRR